MDLLVWARIFSAASILVAVLLAYVVRRFGRWVVVGIGASISSIGGIVWTDTYLFLSYATLALIFMLAWSVFTVSLYFISEKNPRSLVLLAPPLVMISLIIFSLPRSTLFIFAGILLALFDAVDYSRTNMTASMKEADKPLNVLLWPFSIVERGVRKFVVGARARAFLSGGYLVFDLVALVVLPFALSAASGGLLSFEEVVLVFIVVWIVTREESRRGLRRLKDGAQ